jgi:hypothetical protein
MPQELRGGASLTFDTCRFGRLWGVIVAGLPGRGPSTILATDGTITTWARWQMADQVNPAARWLGKLRAKTLTREHQAAAARAQAAGMTAEERSERARKARAARTAKSKRAVSSE